MTNNNNINNHLNNSNSIMLGHFLPTALGQQQSTQLRRMTSTSSDSGDSGVDPSYRQERKIFVGGIPSSVGPEELAQFFQVYGQVEEAFIIYDRFSGRHRGFGFVTFADMNVTKSVCLTRVFNLHGRKIECKRALKREEILGVNEINSNEYKSFRPKNLESSNLSSQTLQISNQTNGFNCSMTVPLSFEQHRQSSSSFINPPASWIINPSIQTISPIYHPVLNVHQPYALVSLSGYPYNDLYQTNLIHSPFLQEMFIPSGSTTMTVPSMINL